MLHVSSIPHLINFLPQIIVEGERDKICFNSLLCNTLIFDNKDYILDLFLFIVEWSDGR